MSVVHSVEITDSGLTLVTGGNLVTRYIVTLMFKFIRRGVRKEVEGSMADYGETIPKI